MKHEEMLNVFRAEILASMARTLWVCHWGDEKEERKETQGFAGQDLFDLAPPTPDNAIESASELILKVEFRNKGRNIVHLFRDTLGVMVMDEEPVERPHEIATEFGYYLVMQVLGHGVSWADNCTTPFTFAVPKLDSWGFELRGLVK